MTYPKISDLNITHPQLEAAVDAALAWAERKSRGEHVSLLLAGPNGVGKTHIAQSILWSIRFQAEDMPIEYEVPVGRSFSAASLIAQLGAHVDSYGTTIVAKPSDFIGDAPIIVVDDIGAQVVLPYVGGQLQSEEIQIRLFMFLEACLRRVVRYVETGEFLERKELFLSEPPSVIMTTNLDIGDGSKNSEFAQYVGERSWSRIQEMCPKGFIVNMRDVPDYRKVRGGR